MSSGHSTKKRDLFPIQSPVPYEPTGHRTLASQCTVNYKCTRLRVITLLVVISQEKTPREIVCPGAGREVGQHEFCSHEHVALPHLTRHTPLSTSTSHSCGRMGTHSGGGQEPCIHSRTAELPQQEGVSATPILRGAFVQGWGSP